MGGLTFANDFQYILCEVQTPWTNQFCAFSRMVVDQPCSFSRMVVQPCSFSRNQPCWLSRMVVVSTLLVLSYACFARSAHATVPHTNVCSPCTDEFHPFERSHPARCPLHVQGYLAHQKPPPPTTLQKNMPRAVWWSWGGGRLFMSEVPLYVSVLRKQPHMQTLVIYKVGFIQNYYTFTLMLLIRIVLCSKSI